jgi:hypothetical protein
MTLILSETGRVATRNHSLPLRAYIMAKELEGSEIEVKREKRYIGNSEGLSLPGLMRSIGKLDARASHAGPATS